MNLVTPKSDLTSSIEWS